MKFAAIVITLAIATPAAALPPKEFDHPYNGKVVIIRTGTKAANSALCLAECVRRGRQCPALEASWGCTVVPKAGETCVIFIADDNELKADGAVLEHVIRH